MKLFKVKPMYYDEWFGKNDVDSDYILTWDEVCWLCELWNCDPYDVLYQLEEIGNV